jgi:opacity protein-like surface antigen
MGKGFGFGSCARTGLRALAMALGALAGMAQPASADWRLYAAGDLGYSVSEGSASGEVEIGPTFDLGGDDTAVSPLLGGAFGLAVPMDEIAPLELPRGWRLPDWDVRAEIEAVGLREYKYSTDPIVTGEGKVQTKLETWSLFTNFSLDVPLRGLYRPISWTSARLFGRWRLRTLKLILDRTCFSPVAGIGVANLDAKTQEAVTNGSEEVYNFAWQAGAALGYRVTDRVVLSLGYRYIDPGTAKYRLRDGGVPQDSDSFIKIDPDIHEARASVRVEFWDFASPWR